MTVVTSVTTDDLLNLNVGVRADSFIFDLLDDTHTLLGSLDVSADDPPTVNVDTSRNATRALTGLTIRSTDLSAIDPIHHRIRPAMVLQNGDRFDLGVYMFGQDARSPYSWGERMTPELVDETFLVDRALDQTASLAVGDSIIGLIAELLDPIGLPSVAIDADDQAAGSPLTYRVGSGRYAALAALAGLLGCFPPFFDNDGTFRFKLAPTPGTPSDHTFDVGGRILDGTVTTNSTAYRAPNRYQVIADGVAAPVVGVYDLPPSAPHSAAATGRIVTVTRNMQGLADQTLADLAAYIDALTDRTPYRTVSFSTTADPRHGSYDTMNVLGVSYLETAWSLQLAPGGAMSHQGTELWL